MWTLCARRVVGAFVFCGCVSVAFSFAQEPPQQPQSSSGYEDVHTLAARLLKYADAADCHKGDCKLLVTNFILPTEHSSFYGSQIADRLAHEIQTLEPAIQLIDRSVLYSYLETERIPSENSGDNILRAIGADHNATTVVVGTTKRLDDNTVELSARMLSVNNKDHLGNSAEVNLFAPLAVVDLSPSEPYPLLQPITQTPTGEPVYRLGLEGISAPSCFYMPNPPYSAAARAMRIGGALIIEAIVNLQGNLENLRIIRGLPGGLSENAIQTLKTWRCKPALKDGKPVPVVVPFKIDFRLY